VDYHLYLIAIEKQSRNWEVRMSNRWLIESDGSRWDNFGYAIDSDDHDCQTGWKDPLVIFASLPIPHATDCPNRRIVLTVNLRTHRLVGYLFESAPEIAELGSVWDQRELIIDLELKRFVQIVKYSINENQTIVTSGIFNHFRESNRHLHVGMDTVITIKYIQFLRDAICGANLSAPCNVDEESSSLFDMEEHLRDLLCRGSARGWMSSHRGITTEEMWKCIPATSSTFDIFSDQLLPSHIINDEKRAGRKSWAPTKPSTSLLMRYEVDLPQSGLTSLKIIRQSTSNMVILLKLFGAECSSLAKDEEDCEVAPLVETMIQRRCSDTRRGLLNGTRKLDY
jgi:hypothetical protein